MDKFKTVAVWTGIVVIGLCGVVLLGGGKVMSGTLMVATAFILALPVKRHRLPRWVRVVLLGVVFAMVAWNISTTDLPDPSHMMVAGCVDESASTYTRTGITFLDQVLYIFSGFLAQAAPS
ncbi:hypothetical protein [Glycomyces harbinensis]|uniref:Uncharacterized protein n=1 Tax=Glycomyces harbinensis TaxID=58114 RepID=A0A1G7DPL6_9ACTN|nr:hypothetical protein [Glycomyces harbinensis]SDE53412.1 hypothetical protein SAMN05216270_12718 [Glycomyces harbinensis]